MTPEEALRNILTLADGSDEVEDVHAASSFAEHQNVSREGVGTLFMTRRHQRP